MKYEFYKHTSPSGKSYIGITSTTMEDRWEGHKSAAEHDSQDHFHRAIRKYSPETFTHELLEIQEFNTQKEAGDREIELIQEHNTFISGYNMTIGGFLPPNHTGRIKINKDNKNKSIEKCDLGQYLKDGWVIGHKNKGKYIINRDGITTTICKTELPNYEALGWIRGNLATDLVWLKRGDEILRVNPSDVDSKLLEGWERGRHSPSDETRVLLQQAQGGENNSFYGKTHSDESVKLMKMSACIGLYYTPNGVFTEAEGAGSANSVSGRTIQVRCFNPGVVVKGNQYTPDEFKGKTWRENGFYFVPKEEVLEWEKYFK